jgi:plastocyanin
VPQPPVVQPQALTIVARATKFSPSQLTAIAGATITVTLDNQDAGITHDLIIYTPSGATAAQTPAFAGPAQQSTTFTPGAVGNYFFKCSLHPVAMTGAISIQP